jgi:hypothetical protein
MHDSENYCSRRVRVWASVGTLRLPGALAVLLCVIPGRPASAQLSDADIVALQARGRKEGWTFVVRQNEATKYSLKTLRGTKAPKGWVEQPVQPPSSNAPMANLPAAFD